MYEFLNFSDYINKICEPLFKYLPIRHFSYIEVYMNGSFHALSSSRDLFEGYLQRNYYQRTPFHSLVAFGKPGFYLNDFYTFPELPPLADHNTLLAEYDFGHTCLILKREVVNNAQISKIYSYEGSLDDRDINHLYLNNLDILKRFTQYFDHKLSSIRNSLPIGSVPVQYEMGFNDFSNEENEDQHTIIANRTSLISLLNNTGGEEPRPTPRELEIIQWNLKGKTAEETAHIMGISRRTVEKHFEKLRKKFGCYSKSQVALKMAKLLDC